MEGDPEIPERFRRFKEDYGDSWEISEIQWRFRGDSDILGRFLRFGGRFPRSQGNFGDSREVSEIHGRFRRFKGGFGEIPIFQGDF